MSNANKRKGTQWEVDLLPLLARPFPSVLRAPRWGSQDRGDFVNTLPFVFEAKNCKSIDLASFVDQAKVEATHAGAQFPVVLIKRRQKPADQGYAVMEVGTLLELITHINQGEQS